VEALLAQLQGSQARTDVAAQNQAAEGDVARLVDEGLAEGSARVQAAQGQPTSLAQADDAQAQTQAQASAQAQAPAPTLPALPPLPEGTDMATEAVVAPVEGAMEGAQTAPPARQQQPASEKTAQNATYGSFLGHPGQEKNQEANQTTTTTAHTEAAPQPDLLAPGQSLVGSALSTAAYLCLILGCIYLGYWLLKRFGPSTLGRNKGGQNPRLTGRLMVGPKQHVDVVRIDKRTLVLGVTEHQITLLTELDARAGQFYDEEDEDAFTDFAEMLGKKNPADGDD
jgi:flagellar biosynthetic protein FliO